MKKEVSENWRKRDRSVFWHPFTQMQDWQNEPFPVIERGEGNYLIDVDGAKYLDGVSSLWCNVFGHQVPEINQAVQDQLKKIAHTTALGLTHPSAIELAEKLLKIAPQSLARVFYSDSGSEAVEIAVKIAFQYWQQKGETAKQKFIKLGEAYHGDTLGSVSIGGIDLFHHHYGALTFKTIKLPPPAVFHGKKNPIEKALHEKEVLDAVVNQLEETLKKHHHEIAALIMEPLMQGAAGMLLHAPGFLKKARELTQKYNVLLVLDEVATGFGRTGKMFACEHEGVQPDILCLAKGITGGYLPLAATLTTEKIYQAFLGKYEELKTFFHGHTYTANPLACAAAIATLDLFEKNKTIEGLQPKIKFIEKRLKDFWKLPCVGDIRQLGLMVGIEIFESVESRRHYSLEQNIGHQIIRRARAKGAILRPLGPVLVLMPPLSLSEPEIDKLLTILYESIQEETKQG
ncbi:MAG TPA: adenosylmethionine--8-amino-7-oxononanoate transaminase [Candidatus Omnitrophica bacterium]|nr:adenosylmethionine--8-amino-7-oxononanoate transaminase [Candidatus Omnitrophota bacterium]